MTAENLEMRSKVAKVELENADFRKRFQQLESTLLSLKKPVEEISL